MDDAKPFLPQGPSVADQLLPATKLPAEQPWLVSEGCGVLMSGDLITIRNASGCVTEEWSSAPVSFSTINGDSGTYSGKTKAEKQRMKKFRKLQKNRGVR